MIYKYQELTIIYKITIHQVQFNLSQSSGEILTSPTISVITVLLVIRGQCHKIFENIFFAKTVS